MCAEWLTAEKESSGSTPLTLATLLGRLDLGHLFPFMNLLDSGLTFPPVFLVFKHDDCKCPKLMSIYYAHIPHLQLYIDLLILPAQRP